MKKQKKISVSDSTAPKPFKPVIGKNAFKALEIQKRRWMQMSLFIKTG
jgi:hypothetical protein